MRHESETFKSPDAKKQVEKKYVYDMEACSLDTNNKNNGWSCKDVIKVSAILQSSLANPEHVIKDARSFVDGFSPTDKTLHQFITKIVRQNNSCAEELRSSKINNRTEKSYQAQDTHGHEIRRDCEESLKEKDVCCHSKFCTHLLDLVILLMAVAGNFTTTVGDDKCLPTGSLDDESAKTNDNSFRAFSLRIWKRGVKSVGLFRERTSTAMPRDDGRIVTNNADATVITAENNNKELADKDELKAETHEITQNGNKLSTAEKRTNVTEGSNPTVAVSSSVEQSSGNTTKHEQIVHIAGKDNTKADGTPQKTRRKRPNLIDSHGSLKSELVDGGVGEAREHSKATVKELKLGKEIQQKETNYALQSQAERWLIKEKMKASLGKEQTEKEILTRECEQLQTQFDEYKRSTRQHTFMLKSRLERLQYAKLAAEQGCLKFSLKQERLVVYEQHVTLICHRIIQTVKGELEQTHDLFDFTNAICACSLGNPTWDECRANGEGFTMYEAHDRLEKQVLELIRRYRSVIQLLTGAKHEKLSDNYKQTSTSNFSTIEDRKPNPVSTDNVRGAEYEHDPMTESDSSCCFDHHSVSAQDIRGHELSNMENRSAEYERRDGKKSLKMEKKTDKRTCRAGQEHLFTCQRKVDDQYEKEQLRFCEPKMPSSSDSLNSDMNQYPTCSSSIDTVNHGQRSCSSIVELVTSSQTSSIQTDFVQTGFAKLRNIECSACRKNREESRRVKKSMSTCRSRGRLFKIHYV